MVQLMNNGGNTITHLYQHDPLHVATPIFSTYYTFISGTTSQSCYSGSPHPNRLSIFVPEPLTPTVDPYPCVTVCNLLTIIQTALLLLVLFITKILFPSPGKPVLIPILFIII